MSSRTSTANSSSFLPQMSWYSWRELASPQNEYQTETLRGLAMSASRYSSTSSRSACTGESFSSRHRRQHALLELARPGTRATPPASRPWSRSRSARSRATGRRAPPPSPPWCARDRRCAAPRCRRRSAAGAGAGGCASRRRPRRRPRRRDALLRRFIHRTLLSLRPPARRGLRCTGAKFIPHNSPRAPAIAHQHEDQPGVRAAGSSSCRR